MRRAVATGFPSSLTATMPADFIAEISASASPLLPAEAAPMGHTRTVPAAAARSTIERVTEALSLTGCVLGMQQTAVNPPRAADRVPVSMVSDISPPGSRRWQCRSMKPGATIRPLASNTSAPLEDSRFAPTWAMRSPLISTSSVASVFVAGSRTRPFLIRSIRTILCGVGRVRGRAADEVVEQGHANREAVGDLFEHAGLRAIGDGGIDFEAADDGAGVQHERVGLREQQARGRELVLRDVFVWSERGLMEALGLHAQDRDDVGAAEALFDAMHDANAGREFFEVARDPHGGATERDFDAEFGEQVNIGTGYAAVENVAEDGDVPAFEFAFAVADGERVEQSLGGVLVGAVAGVEHGDFQALGDEFGGAGGGVADHDAVGAHGFEGADGVDQRFALFQAGGFGLQGHGVGAETGSGCGEADASAGGGFEEGDGDGLAAEGGEFFQRMALEFLERLGLVENKCNLFAGEVFRSEQM